jgi:hypothetical protein
VSRAGGRDGGAAHRRRLALPVLLTLFALLPAVRLSAQNLAAGRVLRPETSDSTPLPGVRVVLHQVGRRTQGPLDSTVSDAGGRFRFRFAADTSAIYLLSARYGGIEYFSSPVHLNPSRPDTAIPLVVYDTSSRAPVALAARHVVIPRPGEDGSREVLDLIVLRNGGRLARVAPDSNGASWSGPLPPGREGLDVGESDVSPDAVERRGDSVYLAAPIGPGEKQLSLQYHLPGGRTHVEIPLGGDGGTVNVMLEEPAAAAQAPGLALADTQLIGGRTFRRWSGELPAGTTIEVRLPGAPRTPLRLLAALVAALALALGVGTWYLLARGRAVAGPAAGEPVDALLNRIAALDARFLGREAEVDAAEWARYQADRSRLKAELERRRGAAGAVP